MMVEQLLLLVEVIGNDDDDDDDVVVVAVVVIGVDVVDNIINVVVSLFGLISFLLRVVVRDEGQE